MYTQSRTMPSGCACQRFFSTFFFQTTDVGFTVRVVQAHAPVRAHIGNTTISYGETNHWLSYIVFVGELP